MLDPRAKQKSKFAPRANFHFLVECGETGSIQFNPLQRTVTRSKHVDFVESRTYLDYDHSQARKNQEEFTTLANDNEMTKNPAVQLRISTRRGQRRGRMRPNRQPQAYQPILM